MDKRTLLIIGIVVVGIYVYKKILPTFANASATNTVIDDSTDTGE